MPSRYSRCSDVTNVPAMFCRAAGRYRSIMRILVTGGAGFIGSHYVRTLRGMGYRP